LSSELGFVSRIGYLVPSMIVDSPPQSPSETGSQLLDEYCLYCVSGKMNIQKGDYMVHKQIGIGVFEGVSQVNGITYIKLRFCDGEMDLHELDAMDDLALFRRKDDVGEYETLELNSMQSTKAWLNKRRRLSKKAFQVVQDLEKLYDRRNTERRQLCSEDGESMRTFEAMFPFDPTPDQSKVFAEVREDMTQRPEPMDRVVIGDVGFGKTEIAMRAIYRMVRSGRQVAMLAPTTVLVAQHFRLLRQRMPDFRIERLSSTEIRTREESEALLLSIKNGDVDIVIGTRSVLAPHVVFGNLGLVVIDEEQRFGVKHKETLKTLHPLVDVLSLTATPIPRTMYMCLAGVRGVSKLLTPPPGRKPIETVVMARDNQTVSEAIQLELDRGGQVFYVVSSIKLVMEEVDFLQKLLPHARITFGYGGLDGLEERIISFAAGEFDILVGTPILENGLDIPKVNTLIIQESQLFALTQLHQLRGRVGRSKTQAYAYFMHPGLDELSVAALKRLKVIEREDGLGAGPNIAIADLQFRGAGNLLGTEQKGNDGVDSLGGQEMYLAVLQEAMANKMPWKKTRLVKKTTRSMSAKRKLGMPESRQTFVNGYALN